MEFCLKRHFTTINGRLATVIEFNVDIGVGEDQYRRCATFKCAAVVVVLP